MSGIFFYLFLNKISVLSVFKSSTNYQKLIISKVRKKIYIFPPFKR